MNAENRARLTKQIDTLGIEVHKRYMSKGILNNKGAFMLEKNFPGLAAMFIATTILSNGLGWGIYKSAVIESLPGSRKSK